jgi:hypothetical protein
MTDLFQPSPLFLFIILFKTTIYIPMCLLLGLLMSIFSKGRPRLASSMTTILCLIIILTTNPILFSTESLEFPFFVRNLSNLAQGWFLPFFISFLFLLRTILYKFSNILLETLHLMLLGLALLLMFLTL